MAKANTSKTPARVTMATRLQNLKGTLKVGPFKTPHSAYVRASQIRTQARGLGVEVTATVDAETSTIRITKGSQAPARSRKAAAPAQGE